MEVVWATEQPYQSVVDCTARGVTLRGLTLRHASPSVANNYCVYVHDGSDMRMEQCDISSRTGTGVGVEGAAPSLTDCRVAACARHGVAIFGPLDPELDPPGGGTLLGCDISGNGLDGVLVRSGAEPSITDCIIHDNKGAGLSLQDGGGVVERNSIRGNGRGAVTVTLAFSLDSSQLAARNEVLGGVSYR